MCELLGLNIDRPLGGGDRIKAPAFDFAILGAQALDAFGRRDFPFPPLLAEVADGIEDTAMRFVVAHVKPSPFGAEL
jgi:hypothetical protein